MHFIQYAAVTLFTASTVFASSYLHAPVKREPCITAVAVPKPSEYHCGAQLHLATPKLLHYSSSSDTFEACRTRCLVDSRCISFGHSPHHGACHAFTESLHEMGATHAQTDMEYYNRHCFATSGDCPVPTGSFTSTMTITVLSTTTQTHESTATGAA